jgi:hypothetical protein
LYYSSPRLLLPVTGATQIVINVHVKLAVAILETVPQTNALALVQNEYLEFQNWQI